MQEFATRKAIAQRIDLRLLNCLFRKYRMAVRIMKLTAIILMAACLQLSAEGISQTVTITVKEAPLFSVLKAIEKQTDFTFIISNRQLQKAKPVSISATNMPLQQVLDLCFKDQPLTYKIIDKVISVIVKEGKSDKMVFMPPLPQNIDVNGRVMDENGTPAQGVNITVKGTGKGASTNYKGEFELIDIDENAYLVVTSIGYDKMEVPLNGKKFISLQLKIAIGNLDELQVIAYGTTSKRLNTGNVTSIKASDIQQQPVNNPLLALQGRVAGLFITQANGLPGSAITVRIQGQNSIGRGNEPFYVIDGVPFTGQTLPTLNSILGNSPYYDGSTAGAGNPLSYINPADIESIDILKDADATAIYGSRAANGAILITTKKGKAGQAKIDVNFQTGWGKVAKKMNLLDVDRYLEMRSESYINDGLPVPNSNTMPSTSNYDLTVWDQNNNTDWQKVLIGGTSKYMDGHVTVSGGNSTTQYLIGGGYHRETTVFPGDFNDAKSSLQVNVNSISTNQKFRIQLSASYLIDNNKLAGADVTSNAVKLAPNAPSLYNDDGTLNWAPSQIGTTIVSTWNNPLYQVERKYNNNTSNLIGNLLLSYRVFDKLLIKSSFGYTNLQTNEINMSPFSAIAPELRVTNDRSSSFGYSNIKSWIIEPQASYSLDINKGKLELLVGTTFQENNNNQQQYTGSGYSNDFMLGDIKSAPRITVGNSMASTYKYNAVFSRVNYNWQNKYIINLSARRDGSSRFGSENLFNDFWSAGGAWILSNEEYLQKALHFISFSKLRFSYGTTGNDQIGDYQFLDLFSAIDGSTASPYQGVTSLAPNGLSNPYLQWEETKKVQVGFDLGFFNDKILLNANYVHNQSSNQLRAYRLPITTGFTSIEKNYSATVQNTAWEFSLNSTIVRNKMFTWTSSLNLTIPKNKLVKYENLETSSDASHLIVGEPINIVKAFRYIGVDPLSGLYLFLDNAGNFTSTPNSSLDKTILIKTDPTLYGGFQNQIQFKGLEIAFLFQFVKQMGQNYFAGDRPGFFSSGPSSANVGNQPFTVLNRWQKVGDMSEIQRYSAVYSSIVRTPFENLGISDAIWSNASFIRLKNLSISWNLPKQWMKKGKINNCRFYLHGQNLFTITNYKGLDPEARSFGLPPLRIVTLGFQVSL